MGSLSSYKNERPVGILSEGISVLSVREPERARHLLLGADPHFSPGLMPSGSRILTSLVSCLAPAWRRLMKGGKAMTVTRR